MRLTDREEALENLDKIKVLAYEMHQQAIAQEKELESSLEEINRINVELKNRNLQ